jgi:hypothetical protein
VILLDAWLLRGCLSLGYRSLVRACLRSCWIEHLDLFLGRAHDLLDGRLLLFLSLLWLLLRFSNLVNYLIQEGLAYFGRALHGFGLGLHQFLLLAAEGLFALPLAVDDVGDLDLLAAEASVLLRKEVLVGGVRVQLVQIVVPLRLWLVLIELDILQEDSLLLLLVLAFAAGCVLVLGVGGRLADMLALLVAALALEAVLLDVDLNLVHIDPKLLFLLLLLFALLLVPLLAATELVQALLVCFLGVHEHLVVWL